uniref:AB hydrolase-1 domain-containing protein n=1 Tax=Ciona savignyi TaxID=51511 RepID=H2YPB3_CIOSA
MNILPDVVPSVSQTAKFEVVMPKRLLTSTKPGLKPACIHMAGTGDHGFHRRRELLGKPLLEAGITSVLLENPFYGSRKPKDQWRSGLLHVNDLFVMGSCLILEAQVLLHWLKRNGFGPLGLTGISMGGHMASLAATNWPEPVALIPCMSWTSASVVWTEGVLSRAIPWRVLEQEYSKKPIFEKEISKFLKEVDSYTLGKEFAGHTGSNGPQGKLPDAALDKENNSKDEKRRQRETVRFMRGVMDQVTHLGNFSVPVDPTMATFVIAKGDAYFPKSNLTPVKDIWPGCQIREINSGHVAGCLIHTSAFNRAIIDTFSRLITKYHTGESERETSISDGSNELVIAQPSALRKFSARQSFSLKSFVRAFLIKA